MLGEDIEKEIEQEVMAKALEEEDEELLAMVASQNRPKCFCFKKHVTKELVERVIMQRERSENFKAKTDGMQGEHDITRILKAGQNKEVDDYGKVYNAKEHHGLWRKRFITLQNSYWADVPMTIVAVLSLFFIPVFQYCHDHIHDESSGSSTDESNGLLKAIIWINFVFAVFFGLEITMKSYAFGLRRAFSQCDLVLKLEFLIQPIIWSLWFFFVVKTS